MKINLNQTCSFVLTEIGANIWNDRYAGLDIPEKYKPATKHEGEEVSALLWEVMQLFGPNIHLGMVDVLFLGCNLEIEDGSQN